jgi:hypothetical protein
MLLKATFSGGFFIAKAHAFLTSYVTAMHKKPLLDFQHYIWHG